MGVVVLAGGVARAAPPMQGPGLSGGTKGQPLNLRHAQLGTHGLGEAARAKMRNDDCAGALDLFDEALRTSIDATLYRDRGLCHEKLDHPYPAMDDYRRYLTSVPDAPDADSIRGRLALLEDTTRGRSHAATDDDSPFASSGAGAGSARGQGGGANGGLSGGMGAGEGVTMGPAGQTSTKVDTYEDDDDDEVRGPLRGGRGWSLAPVFAEHKWFFEGTSFGDSQTWAECVGLELRYSHSPRGALLLEAAYAHFNSTNTDAAVIYGLTSLLAYELRFPLGGRYENQFFVAPGVGYDQLQITPNDPNLPNVSEGILTGRLRIGYRHLLGSSTALELSLDGGAGRVFIVDGSGSASGTGLLGLNVAVAWGL